MAKREHFLRSSDVIENWLKISAAGRAEWEDFLRGIDKAAFDFCEHFLLITELKTEDARFVYKIL